MKKFIVTTVVLGIFVLYGAYQRLGLTPADAAGTTVDTTPSPSSGNSNTNSTTGPTVIPNSSGSSTTNTGIYKDGIYTGTPGDAYYGMVQVKTTIQNGRITDVQFLQYPNDRRTSQMINSQAMPMLKNEAIKAQSSKVNIISGATDTSLAFIQSLGSSLQAALGH